MLRHRVLTVALAFLASGAALTQAATPARDVEPLAGLWGACRAGWQPFAETLAAYRPTVAAHFGTRDRDAPVPDPDRDPAALLAVHVWPELLPARDRRRGAGEGCALRLSALHGALDEGDRRTAEVAFAGWYQCVQAGAPQPANGLTRRLIDCQGALFGATPELPRVNEELSAFARRVAAEVRPLNDPRYQKIGYDPRWLAYRLRVGGYFYDGWVLGFDGLVADHGFRYEGSGMDLDACRSAYLSLGRVVARAHAVTWPEFAGDAAPDLRLALPRRGRIASFGPRAANGRGGSCRAGAVVQPAGSKPIEPVAADPRR